LSPGSALSVARSHRAGSDLGVLERLEGGGYRVSLRRAGEAVPARGDLAITLDACGAVVSRARSGNLGQFLSTRTVEIHGGRIARAPGEWLAAASGLALAALPCLGLAARFRQAARAGARH
jgi:hypothetical protein